jgi:hypothetical protein
MTIDTTDLEQTLDAWRELNAKRAEAMGRALDDEDSDAETAVKQFNERELFRLRDIAGEAMALVDRVKAAST